MAIRSKTVEKAQFQGGDARIEEELTRRGIQFTFEPKATPDLFDRERSRNNQARFEALDEKQVDTYAEAMKRGDVFPPVIAYKRAGLYVVVDGNHRLEAADRARKPIRVYDVSGAPADAINVLGIYFNTKHGKVTSEAERISHALYLMGSGSTIPDAAAVVNLPVRIVQRAAQSKQADQRFLECNIPALTVEKMHDSLKKRLAQITTDEGFVAAVDLAVRARFGQAEVFKLVTELSELRSSKKQVDHVHLWEVEYQDRIAGSAGGILGGAGRRTQTPKTRVSIALTSLTSLPDDLSSVASHWAGPEREEAAKRARAAAKRLNELARALSA